MLCLMLRKFLLVPRNINPELYRRANIFFFISSKFFIIKEQDILLSNSTGINLVKHEINRSNI